MLQAAFCQPEHHVDLNDFCGDLLHVFGIKGKLDLTFIEDALQVFGDGLTDEDDAEMVPCWLYHNAHFVLPFCTIGKPGRRKLKRGNY